ncbi:DivIVA domain-containing protein [Williamsoniiplasma lucivorax]|uniref:DivIVA domain-containing protein n=1 Tax=Williamsoniiplasma lucivorax TaxID=209274 RepID=A0A2S5RD77_9MOLU|nr:DivIVA domain-containing protein [Williamsoniiplasma lucivorax]PPE05258.1 DivIVA domain-containing protein [Williamsoniiplasma lucivorax]
MKKIKNFTIEDLQTYEFPIELQGYKMEDVNVLLDEIQQDYIAFQSEIDELAQDLSQTQAELKRTKEENVNLKEQNKDFLTTHNKQIKENLSNSDIYARISNLESAMNKILNHLENNKK